MRALLDGKDVLAVLPTGYGKSLIYQMFVCAKDFQMNGKATIACSVSPLVSFIKDQIQDIKAIIGYAAVDISELSVSGIRQCNFKFMLCEYVLRNSRRRPLGKS